MFPKCKVNEITTKNCTTSKNFDDLEISDVLENIKLLLDYIKNRKQRDLRQRAKNNLVRARAGRVRSEYLELRKTGVRRHEAGSRAFTAEKDL